MDRDGLLQREKSDSRAIQKVKLLALFLQPIKTIARQKSLLPF